MSEPSETPRRSWRKELVAFLKSQLASGAATSVDWVLMTVLIFAGLYYLLAICAGAIAGAITDFCVKRWWAFRSANAPLRRSALRYTAVSASSAALNCGLAYVLVEFVGAPKVPSAIVASLVIGLLWNYPMHRLFVFEAHPKQPEARG